MATLSDLGLSLLQQSKDFYVNPNFSLQGPSFGTGSGTKKLAIDEFIDVLPFESFDRNPLAGITASRPSVTEPDPAFLPGANNVSWGVAEWFPPSSAIPPMRLELETSVDATYETFRMRRIGALFELDPYQIKIVSTRASGVPGPDPIPTLIRTASLSVVRSLSRDAINNIDGCRSRFSTHLKHRGSHAAALASCV